MKFAISLVFASVALCQEPANLLEFRGSSTQYRYADWMHTFQSNLVTDIYYLGGSEPAEANEINIGLGYLIKPAPGLNLIPIMHGTLDREGQMRGFKVGLVGSFERGKWKSSWYGAYSYSVANREASYAFLDPADVTYSFSKRLELGASTGFFRQAGAWNPQLGPLLKVNDKLGYWSVSYRFGPGTPKQEFRINRVFVF